MTNLQELGVGIIYFQGLENLIESHFDLLQAIEIEPQTLWYSQSAKCDSYMLAADRNELIKSYPCPKIFHGVGFPIGGSILPGEAHFSALDEHIKILEPVWISEHLSYNAFAENDSPVTVNFLLPPLQTAAGVETAIKSIKHYQSKVDLPFAFETGVNYLRPREFELEDGDFVAGIAEGADCNILLDLHNILANEKNGRQRVREFVNQLPLERVCEIHIAGGFVHNKYYLDAHSGLSSAELFEILAWAVGKTPNLKAIIFEMLPVYAEYVSDADMRRQLEQMNRIWEARGKDSARRTRPRKIPVRKEAANAYSVKDWEYTLGNLALSKPISGAGSDNLARDLAQDDGLKIINELMFHFRASMVVGTLKMTTRLLRLSLGEEAFDENLAEFFRTYNPQIFGYLVARQYSEFLTGKNYQIPFLYKILEFEMAASDAKIDNQTRTVEFDFNPFPVFRELSGFKMPENTDSDEMRFVLEIKPDELVDDDDLVNLKSVYLN